jgi:tetratricopeptide (TPR) repeat protein
VGPELLVVSAVMAAIGVLSARRSRTDLVTHWRRGHAALAEGRHGDAEACFRSSLEMSQRRFGADHWRTALHVNALAQALLGQGRLDDAAPLVERAMGILALCSPVPHPDLVGILLSAAALEGARGRHGQAADLVERAQRGAKADPAMLAAVERTRAKLAASTGDGAGEADALARIPFERLEPGDVKVLAACGLARQRQGDAQRAVRCLASAHALAERESPGEFAEAFFRGLLGEAQARAGHDEEALRSLDQAVVDYDVVVGEHHAATAPLLVELAAVRLRLGDAAGARVACRRVLASRTPAATHVDDPYRVSAMGDDPLEPERKRALALLARMRSSEGG